MFGLSKPNYVGDIDQNSAFYTDAAAMGLFVNEQKREEFTVTFVPQLAVGQLKNNAQLMSKPKMDLKILQSTS